MKFKLSLLLIVVFQFLVNAQDMAYTKHIIQKLTSPEFKGRGYVEKGDKISADFIAKEFQTIGLKMVNKDSYFQKFNISINTFPKKVQIKLGGEELKVAKDYLIESSSPSIKGTFPIIKISRNDIDSKSKLVSVINKASNTFILIDNRNKKGEMVEMTKQIDEYIQALKFSKDINVKGIIIYSTDKLTWESSTSQSIRPIVLLNKEIDLSNLSTIEITIDAKFIKKYETQNVVGMIKGSSNSDSTIVLVAHYDHLGKLGADTYFPGANDNASGVALLLNLAKHYTVNKPKYTMVFIAFSGEELGLFGASAFVNNPLIPLSKIKFLLNFDLAGTGDEGLKVVNGSVYKDKFDKLTSLNKEFNLMPKIDIRGTACNSDHCMFHQKGVPCFYTYTLGGIAAYHDVYDIFETLPLTKFTEYTKLMIAFINSI